MQTRGPSPSSIVANALGLTPDGLPSKRDCYCCYCGHHILKGELCAPFSPGPNFMDTSSLAAKGSDSVCGACAVMTSSKALNASGYGVYSANETLPFRKWQDVRSALMNPPKGAFVALYATAKSQHMAWRAVVNYSQNLFYVRVGLRDLLIRRSILLKTLETVERMGRQLGRVETKLKTGEIRSLPTPFRGLSPDLKDVNTGLFISKVWTTCAKDDIAQVMQLTTGELWAMRFLVSPGAGATPVVQNE